ncbi:MAG: hypothetical protein IPF50_16610 [Proteobacteria bacterium]|nr:hypothetical protein [Pseudomonadota bacterium]
MLLGNPQVAPERDLEATLAPQDQGPDLGVAAEAQAGLSQGCRGGWVHGVAHGGTVQDHRGAGAIPCDTYRFRHVASGVNLLAVSRI